MCPGTRVPRVAARKPHWNTLEYLHQHGAYVDFPEVGLKAGAVRLSSLSTDRGE